MSLGLFTFVTSVLAVELARRASLRWNVLDRPGARSSHDQPTPRIGGVGVLVAWTIALAIAAAGAWSPSRELAILLAGAGSIAIIGLADDLLALRASSRIVLQAAIATAVVLAADRDIPFGGGALAIAGSVAWIVWSTNLFNFMDGSDGLAAGQGAIALLAFGELLGGGTRVVALAGTGALCGFLVHNISPARIFMGDALSTSLGFLFGGLALFATRAYDSVWPGLLPIYLFVFDATATLLRRVVRGERWWSAHRTHAYQLLLQRGWSHRAVQMLYLAFAAALAELALQWTRLDAAEVTVTLVVVHVALVVGLTWIWRSPPPADRTAS
jgi:Fuc2NAc and GlcNAc transferase